MANRRCFFQVANRYLRSVKTITPALSQSSIAPPFPQSLLLQHRTLTTNPPISHPISNTNFILQFTRHFSSSKNSDNDEDIENEDDITDDEEDYESGDDIEDSGNDTSHLLSPEEKLIEAAEIGYTVIGPLQKSDRVFKPYEPVFAVIQIGSHQFKVSNRDTIYVEKLKYCDVNDKVVLNKVLMLGSETQTIIGRPILPEAAVHAVVEEHALDAKVIIFKKKRRKNYRRKNGHRQELTKLRITDIQGIEKPEAPTPPKKEKKEKVAVAA